MLRWYQERRSGNFIDLAKLATGSSKPPSSNARSPLTLTTAY